MQRSLFLLPLLCLAIFSQSFGQVGVGLRIGMNFADIRIPDFDNSFGSLFEENTKPGIEIAGIFNVPARRPFSFQVEVQFNRRNREYVLNYNEGFERLQVKLNNVVVIPEMKVNFGGDVAKGFALLGIFLGSGMLSHMIEDAQNGTVYSYEKINIINMEIGAVIGGGVAIEAGPGDVLIDIRGEFGAGIFQDYDGYYDAEGYLSKGFAITMGYLLVLGD